ncbi:hypothetical protein AKJ16_DCAP12297 [Drosera capensis]
MLHRSRSRVIEISQRKERIIDKKGILFIVESRHWESFWNSPFQVTVSISCERSPPMAIESQHAECSAKGLKLAPKSLPPL